MRAQTDPRIQGKPIVNLTLCKVGGHAFLHTGPAVEPPLECRCSCGLYTYGEWKPVSRLAAILRGEWDE